MQELIVDKKLEKLDFYKVLTEAKISVEKLKLVAQDRYTYFFLTTSIAFSISIVILGAISLYFFGLSLDRNDLYFSGLPSSFFFSIGVLGIVFGIVGTRYLLFQLSIFNYRRKVALLLAKEIEQELEER